MRNLKRLKASHYLNLNLNLNSPSITLFSTSKLSKSNLDVLYEQSKIAKTPFFTTQSHLIEIIDDPLEFYMAIHREITHAYHRIAMSTLYIGTGTLQRFMINNIVKRIKKVPSLNATLLMDYNRGQREQNGETPISMISSYIPSDTYSRIRVALHHQSLSSLPGLKNNKILGEISAVHHQKIAIFDDNIIIGGANLSHNYFVNRRDRYMKIRQCPELADYLYEYLLIMAQNGHQVIQGSVKTSQSQNLKNHYKLWKFSHTPQQYKNTIQQQQANITKTNQQKTLQSTRIFTSNLAKPPQPHSQSQPQSRNLAISSSLGSELKLYESLPRQQILSRRQRVRERLINTVDQNDVGNQIIGIENVREDNHVAEIGEKVYIFPYMQHQIIGETREPQIFKAVLENSIQNQYKVRISSGYLNLTGEIIQILKKAVIPTQILCSAPQANSFFRAGKFKKFIPFFYRNFEGKILQKYSQKFNIKQYSDGKWSFHAKGVWIAQRCVKPEDINNEQVDGNYLTILGSSNYNKRSKQRDTQLQLYMYSTCNKFNKRLEREWANIEKDCKRVSLQDIRDDKEIKYNYWFRFLSSIFKSYL